MFALAITGYYNIDMNRRSSARFGVVLLIVVIAVVIIGGIVFLAQSLFGGASQPSADNQPPATNLLTKPTDNTTVVMAVRGPVTAREDHYDIKMEISATKRLLVITLGYDEPKEVKRIELGNDRGAFTDLLLALNDNGYLNQAKPSVEKNDGLCAGGQLINFMTKDGDDTKSDTWTTSCPAVTGSFAGQSTEIINLLLDQIPGSYDAIAAVK